MKKLFICLILIYSVVLTACPKKESQIREAAKASYRISGLTLDVVNGLAKAYDEKLISLDTKDRAAKLLLIIAKGGKNFNTALAAYYKENGSTVDTEKLAVLNALFNSEIVAPFLDTLQILKVISSEKAKLLISALNDLRNVILIISAGFSEVQSMEATKNYA